MGGRGSIGGDHIGVAPVRRVQRTNNRNKAGHPANKKPSEKPKIGTVMTKSSFRERMLALMNKKG
jgi:hypothetical protein